MRYEDWLTALDAIAPNAVITEENGEIVIFTRLTTVAEFAGRDRIPIAEVEVTDLDPDDIVNLADLHDFPEEDMSAYE